VAARFCKAGKRRVSISCCRNRNSG
jgi:hypothetical protein